MRKIEFNDKHVKANIDEEKINKMVKRDKIITISVGTVSIALCLTFLVGLIGKFESKTTAYDFFNSVDCNISSEHAHRYIDNNGFIRYINSEVKETNKLYNPHTFKRTDDYILINKEDSKLLEFIDNEDLCRIDENKEIIEDITNKHQDHIEYEYVYSTRKLTPNYAGSTLAHGIPMGAVRVKLVSNHSWTDNPNHENLTGKQANCHYVYYGYKIIKNDDGEYEIIKSKPVDSLSELSQDFEYIKPDSFYDIIDLSNGNILNYKEDEVSFEYDKLDCMRGEEHDDEWAMGDDNYDKSHDKSK